MALPFTVEQFYGVFRDYNTAMVGMGLLSTAGQRHPTLKS